MHPTINSAQITTRPINIQRFTSFTFVPKNITRDDTTAVTSLVSCDMSRIRHAFETRAHKKKALPLMWPVMQIKSLFFLRVLTQVVPLKTGDL